MPLRTVGRLSALAISLAILADTSSTSLADDDIKHGRSTVTPHVHVAVPPEYASTKAPPTLWADSRTLARGRAIYADKCAVCHGREGKGDGPAAAGLPTRPASFQDARMVGEMSAAYWFWRVSEGGAVEPYRSQGSTMPAWKGELSPHDRWA